MYIANINIYYKFTRTYSHLHFLHFVSSINQTINIILNNLSNFINNCGNILMRILNPGRDSKTQNYEMCNPNINICYKFTRTYSHLHFLHFVSSIN